MPVYELEYSFPYEVDDDSPSGIGDHDVVWDRSTARFKSPSNKAMLQYIEDPNEFAKERIICGEKVRNYPISLKKVIKEWK